LFDILLLDALYAQAPVLKLAERNGWELLVSLKQNQRELYPSAVRLFASRPPIPTAPSSTRVKTQEAQRISEEVVSGMFHAQDLFEIHIYEYVAPLTINFT
jgi:hypothetical protein